MYVNLYWLVCSWVEVHSWMLLMNSFLLFRQCPTCLVCLTWLVSEMGSKWQILLVLCKYKNDCFRMLHTTCFMNHLHILETITMCCIIKVNDTQRRMIAWYIYLTPVSRVNGYIQKRHSTISYKPLTREFTRYWGSSKCDIAKWSKISPIINQLIKINPQSL